MTPRELARGIDTLRRRDYLHHKPWPKQREFLELTEIEALYGGAGAGGKSDALLMGALQYVHVPGYAALILRRTFADLNLHDAIMNRSHEWLRGKDCSWHAQTKTWKFPSGAVIEFGYLDTSKDKYRYQGTAYDYIAFDELTQFPEADYTYLFTRLRQLARASVPVRMRAGTNPGGIGHDWVKRRFIDAETRKEGCAFMPAFVEDNPAMDADAYDRSLRRADDVTYRQLRFGVWEQDAAGLMYHVPDTSIVKELPTGEWSYIRALDFGIVDANAIAILGWRKHDRATYVLSARHFRGGPSELGGELAKDSRPFRRTVGDLGGMGKAFQEDLQTHHRIPIDPANKSEKLGAIRMVNDEYKHGRLIVYAPGCADLLKEYGSLLRREDGTEHPGQDNHCADAVLYGWRASPSYLERSKIDEPAKGSAEWEAAEEKRLERLETLRPKRNHWMRDMMR